MATDRELIEKVKHGEREVYGQLFQKYYDRIYAICLAMLKNPQDAEELAQEVFVLAYLRLDQLREPGRFFPWLKKITRNRSKNRMQKAGPRLVPLDLANSHKSPDAPDEGRRAKSIEHRAKGEEREARGRRADPTGRSYTLPRSRTHSIALSSKPYALRSMLYARGFTLIELSIVIFIILMMTSATVPWMRTFAESTRLRSAARSTRSLMEFARSSTITQRTEYVVLFDPSSGEYWLSLLEFLDEESGDVLTDSSRTSLSESLASLSGADSTDLSEEDEEETEGTFSRTGGILGIPKQLPNGIDIAQISSPRSSSGDNEVEYIVFHPDGTAEDFEIYLQSSSGRIFVLSVAEATGRTGIRELTVEEIEELGLEISQ